LFHVEQYAKIPANPSKSTRFQNSTPPKSLPEPFPRALPSNSEMPLLSANPVNSSRVTLRHDFA
jgi:hypothetical protein